MKITKNGIVKFIDESRLDYYELQGWSGDEKVKLKPVKNTVTKKLAVDEEQKPSSEEEATQTTNEDNKGEY
tara:strand:+ start:7130 stop:7342 length:213 start_codon:yes stop_codon:yes gene_type:complete